MSDDTRADEARREWVPITAHEDWGRVSARARKASTYAFFAGVTFGAMVTAFAWLVAS